MVWFAPYKQIGIVFTLNNNNVNGTHDGEITLLTSLIITLATGIGTRLERAWTSTADPITRSFILARRKEHAHLTKKNFSRHRGNMLAYVFFLHLRTFDVIAAKPRSTHQQQLQNILRKQSVPSSA